MLREGMEEIRQAIINSMVVPTGTLLSVNDMRREFLGLPELAIEHVHSQVDRWLNKVILPQLLHPRRAEAEKEMVKNQAYKEARSHIDSWLGDIE